MWVSGDSDLRRLDGAKHATNLDTRRFVLQCLSSWNHFSWHTVSPYRRISIYFFRKYVKMISDEKIIWRWNPWKPGLKVYTVTEQLRLSAIPHRNSLRMSPSGSGWWHPQRVAVRDCWQTQLFRHCVHFQTRFPWVSSPNYLFIRYHFNVFPEKVNTDSPVWGHSVSGKMVPAR